MVPGALRHGCQSPRGEAGVSVTRWHMAKGPIGPSRSINGMELDETRKGLSELAVILGADLVSGTNRP